MKKYINVCLIIGVCVFIVLTTSACHKENNKVMKRDNSYGLNTNDTQSLEDTLKNEYDINDLEMFFKGSNLNELSCMRISDKTLCFDEVNKAYPVEILRPEKYSVYKVAQGGYFYVFWVETYDDCDEENYNLSVYFTSYLSTLPDVSQFASLKSGENTVLDVKRIDPYCELTFLLSCGTFSYSILNEEKILQIEYSFKDDIKGYEDLVIKEMKVVSRNAVPSKYSAILLKDLP